MIAAKQPRGIDPQRQIGVDAGFAIEIDRGLGVAFDPGGFHFSAQRMTEARAFGIMR